MTRLSSSFELGACANVSPVSTVSANSGKEVETPLTVEFEIFPVCVCLRTNVNLKLSSSSLFKRKRKEGVGAEGGESGSCITLELLVKRQCFHAMLPNYLAYLYIFNQAIVAGFSLRIISGGRE